MFVPMLGRWAIALFAVALGVGCFGAARFSLAFPGVLTAAEQSHCSASIR
jgi:hypothetical protein